MMQVSNDKIWPADISADSFWNYPSLCSDEFPRSRGIPCSARSSNCTEFSMRTGSTQPDQDCVSDHFYDTDSWRNTLTFENARNSVEDSLALLPDLNVYPPEPLQRIQPFVTPPSSLAVPPPIPPRLQTRPLPPTKTPCELFNSPSSSVAKPQQQTTTKKLINGTNGEHIEQLPNLPLRRTPSPHLTPRQPLLIIAPEPSKPPIPPKPTQENLPLLPSKPAQEYLTVLPPKPSQEYLEPKLPRQQEHLQPLLPTKPTQEYLEPKFPRQQEHLQPLLPTIPTQEYLEPSVLRNQEQFQPLLPPKPTQEHFPPILPPKPGKKSHQALLPPKTRPDNSQPSLSPVPQQQAQLPSQSLSEVPLPGLSQLPNPSSQLLTQVPTPISSQISISASQSITQVPHPTVRQTQTPTPESSLSEDETSSSNASPSPRQQIPYRHTSSHSSNHSERRPHFLIRRRSLITVSVVSFLLSLASIGILVLIRIDPFTYRWQERTFREGVYKSCIKCLDLMQNIEDAFLPEFDILFSTHHDGENYCCAQTSIQMSALLKLILRQQEYKPSFQEQPDNEVHTPRAHLSLTTGYESNEKIGGSVMKIVTEDKDQYRDVIVRNNTLGIQVTGLYYVYSNIFFMAKCKDLSKFKTLEHSIHVLSTHDSGSLVKSAHTCCHDCETDRKSIFTGGIFHLMESDQIYTTVTDKDAVDFSQHPYLGLVKLGQ